MADENKPEAPKEDATEKLPPLEGEGNAEKKDIVDDEPPTRQPKEKPEDKEANRLGFELRKRDKAIKELQDKIASFESNQGDEEESPANDKLAERLDRYEEKLQRLESEKAIESDIQGVIAKNPDYKKFEGTLRKYATNDAYKNVPIDFIADGLAKRYREADDTANEKQSGGNTKRKMPGGKKDYANMSREEFAQEQARVLGQI
jgi:hypothetical protein